MKADKGFTLVEVLLYATVFAIAASFLVGILVIALRVQNRETASAEVTQQAEFVMQNIQYYVRGSALIDLDVPNGQATSTLKLLTTGSSTDPTLIYANATKTAIYIKQGSSEAYRLTNDKVNIGNFNVTKYENPGGHAIAQIDLTLNYNTSTAPQFSDISKTLRSAIARVSAATFDSNLLPNSSGNLDFGSAAAYWKDAYFSGNVTLPGGIWRSDGNVGIGTNSPNARLTVVGGDAATTNAGSGIIVKTPNGSSCYRIAVNNSGVVTSTSVACP